MRTSFLTVVAGVVGTLGLAGLAQSPAPPAATQRYPQFENDRVKVWRTVIMPNGPLSPHRHEHGRTIVALAGGDLKIVKVGGATQVVKWETGKAYWLDADPPGELHSDINGTSRPIEVMVVEMKAE